LDIGKSGGGVVLGHADLPAADRYIASLGLAEAVERHADGERVRLRLAGPQAAAWLPGFDTLGIVERLSLDGERRPEDLEREILVALLGSPIDFAYPSADEFLAAIRMRRRIVEAARRTVLAFDTAAAERPEGYWDYADGRGFVVLPGKPLIDALVLATQPEVSGRLYSFSCYRATEYVILLAIAQEAAQVNPPLLAALQAQWEERPIMSGKFHDVFLHEFGTNEEPLPPRYYIPGDRLWFRNPDPHSSDVAGFEGSWVFYLGGGIFTNFWKPGRHFTLADKCLEIYHWRHGVRTGADGEPWMDESLVDERVARSKADPAEAARIVALMSRLRDPKGVYADGGCIDATRECPREVCPGTADIRLPALRRESAPPADVAPAQPPNAASSIAM